MDVQLPRTRRDRSPLPSPPSVEDPRSSFHHSLSAARVKIRDERSTDRRKRKGKAREGRRDTEAIKSSRASVGSLEEYERSRGSENEDGSVPYHRDRSPTYGEAVEPRQEPGRRRMKETRVRTSSRSRCSTCPAHSSCGEEDDGDNGLSDDALSSLLDLTDSVLASSREILSATKALHSKLSQFLLSSSPPSSSSTGMDMLINDVRSEIGLHGDNWDRLNKLERDVEKFGLRTSGKDPRNLAESANRRSSWSLTPIVGIVNETSLRTLPEEGNMASVNVNNVEERRGMNQIQEERSLGIGRPSTHFQTTSPALDTATARKGHLRRSSTAKDLLLQISSAPSTTTATETPMPRPTSNLQQTPSTPSSALSRHHDSSGPLSRHRLSISPSLPSLSSSISTSSLSMTVSQPISPTPILSSYTSTSDSFTHSGSRDRSPRSSSVSPSTSFIRQSPTQATSPPLQIMNTTRRSSHSQSQHRRASTISKSISIAKIDGSEPLVSGNGLADSEGVGLPRAGTERFSDVEGTPAAAADRLRTLQTASSQGSNAATGGSWWGWRQSS